MKANTNPIDVLTERWSAMLYAVDGFDKGVVSGNDAEFHCMIARFCIIEIAEGNYVDHDEAQTLLALLRTIVFKNNEHMLFYGDGK